MMEVCGETGSLIYALNEQLCVHTQAEMFKLVSEQASPKMYETHGLVKFIKVIRGSLYV